MPLMLTSDGRPLLERVNRVAAEARCAQGRVAAGARRAAVMTPLPDRQGATPTLACSARTRRIRDLVDVDRSAEGDVRSAARRCGARGLRCRCGQPRACQSACGSCGRSSAAAVASPGSRQRWPVYFALFVKHKLAGGERGMVLVLAATSSRPRSCSNMRSPSSTAVRCCRRRSPTPRAPRSD